MLAVYEENILKRINPLQRLLIPSLNDKRTRQRLRPSQTQPKNRHKNGALVGQTKHKTPKKFLKKTKNKMAAINKKTHLQIQRNEI